MDAAGGTASRHPAAGERVSSRALPQSTTTRRGSAPRWRTGLAQVSAGGSKQGKCFLISYQNGNGKDGQGRQSERMFWKCLLTMTT